MPAARPSTRRYEARHGHPPHGRGPWAFDAAGTMTPAECRFTYGDAHDTHITTDSTCPRCGTRRVWVRDATYPDAVASLPPGRYALAP